MAKAADLEKNVMVYTCDRCEEEAEEKNIKGWTELGYYLSPISLNMRHLCETCTNKMDEILFDVSDDE